MNNCSSGTIHRPSGIEKQLSGGGVRRGKRKDNNKSSFPRYCSVSFYSYSWATSFIIIFHRSLQVLHPTIFCRRTDSYFVPFLNASSPETGHVVFPIDGALLLSPIHSTTLPHLLFLFSCFCLGKSWNNSHRGAFVEGTCNTPVWEVTDHSPLPHRFELSQVQPQSSFVG